MSSGLISVPGPHRLAAIGNNCREERKWDDGSDHDNVTKIFTRVGKDGIQFIEFENVKDGDLKRGGFTLPVPEEESGKTHEFVINHPEEYVVSIEVWCKNSDLIQGIRFTTNKKGSGLLGISTDKEYSLQVEDKKMIRFHGSYSDHGLTSIGAYIVPVGSGAHRLDAQGGTRETKWDDGSDHDAVTKIYVTTSGKRIQSVKFDYVKGGTPKQGEIHGSDAGGGLSRRDFVINHPEEYLVSVKGWYGSSTAIRGFEFKTNTRTCETFGYGVCAGDTEFTLQVQDKKIIGFHGFANNHLTSIGAYLVPVPAERLEAVGGNGGISWDDGVFHSVRAVSVGQAESGVGMVEFVYGGEAQVVEKLHGKRILGLTDKFELEPNEYITAVDGAYDKIYANEAEVIVMLRFTTNKRESDPFGLTDTGTPFKFEVKGKKIVGFHGSVGDVLLHKIGVYVLPITN